jgi:hypothetical protein
MDSKRLVGTALPLTMAMFCAMAPIQLAASRAAMALRVKYVVMQIP